ncbi:MAG TPA: phage major capsid protein [Phycisphaerae bacterium]|nr:phage major capsid protein [Phycisphaerae bacterium]
MAQLTSTEMDNLLKEVYLPRMRNWMKAKFPFQQVLKRMRRPLVGKEFRVPAQRGHTQGIGAGSETATLPTAGYALYSRPAWTPKIHYGRVQVTGFAMALGEDKKSSYLKAWTSEVRSLTEQFAIDLNREALGDGRGILAYMTAAANTLTPAVSGYQGTARGHMARERMLVDLIDATDDTTVLVSGITITGYTEDTLTLDTATGAGTAVGDYFVRSGTLGYAFSGLHAIIDDGNTPLANYGGIDRTASAGLLFQGQVTDAHSFCDLVRFDEAYDKPGEQADAQVKMILTRPRIKREITRLLVYPQMRYTNPNASSLQIKGWNGVQYGDATMMSDDCVWKDTALFFDPAEFEFAEVEPMGWMDKDGSVVNRVANKWSYEATMVYAGELLCPSPNRGGKLRNAGTPHATVA